MTPGVIGAKSQTHPVDRRVYALVFAAGPSRRMGEPKLLMPFCGRTILETVLDAVLESSVDGAVIVANPMIANVLEGVLPEEAAVAINHDPDSPQIISARLGLSRIKTRFKPAASDGVLLLACDRPQIGTAIINTCAELFRLPRDSPRAICATYECHRDYPIVVSFGEMLGIFDGRPDGELETLWEPPAEVREVPIAGVCRPLDVDTPDDYAKLCQNQGEDRGESDEPALIPFRNLMEQEPVDISIAQTDEQILDCYPVMSELRPHLRREEFLDRIRRQRQHGYHLLYLRSGDRICALAGYRLGENLAWGRHLYVDDLITSTADRSRGYGDALMHWMIDEARRNHCEQLHLDSGVQRFAAHRFYLNLRMDISSHHFCLKL